MNLIANAKTVMIMKKNLFNVGAALAIMFSLSGCQKEIQIPEENNVVKNGTPFELIASPVETRTVNDDMNTRWAADDAINVFHAVAGTTTYVNDGEFTITEANLATNKFTGEINGTLTEGTSYDWYMFYPYTSQVETPANTSKGWAVVGSNSNASQVQSGNNSKAHLAGTNIPLWGKITGVTSTSMPEVQVNQACAFIEFNVTNNSGSDLIVSEIQFTGTEDIVGTYYINYAGENVVYTGSGEKYVSSTATLSVQNAAIISNEGTASFYMAIKPFSAQTGTLKVSVNGYEKEINLTKATSFTAGKIKKINFNYDKPDEYVNLSWIYAGGTSSDLNSVPGVTTNGLGGDYAASNAPYRVRFDSNGDYIQVKTDKAIGRVVVGVKLIGGKDANGEGAIKVQGSANGVEFTDVQTLSMSGEQDDILSLESTASFDESYRYVRFSFVKKVNVGVGPISIYKVSSGNDPVINVEDVNGIAVIGGSFTTSYTLSYWDGDDDVVATCDGSVVTQATASNGTVTYSVAPNYTKSVKEGTITLTSASNGVFAEISVKQLASSGLTVSETTVTIPNNATSATFTLTTKDYGWDAIVTPGTGMNLSVNPSRGNASEEAQTVTVSSTTAATSSEQTLGTIEIYRNGNTSDTQKKTITIKKAATQQAGTTTVKWTATSGGLGSGIGSGTIKTGNFDWNYTRTLVSGSSYSGWTSNCIQLGKNGGVENLTLSTSNIPGTIKSVSVECSSYQGKHNVSITVGGTTYLSSTATAIWTTVSTASGTGSSSGEIVISFTDGTRALYIKSISVVYEQ